MKAGRRPPWPGIAVTGVCLLSGLSLAAGPATAGAAPSKLYAGAHASGAADCSSAANACTLARALGDVAAGGTVELVTPGHEGTASTYYSPGSSGFSIATSLTSATSPVMIEPASGVQTPILDGGGKHPVLKVGNAMHLAISGLVIQNGFSDASSSGGGITDDARAVVTVTDSILSDNYGPQDGGAVQNGSGGTVTATDSTFADNSACLGGAISNGYRGSGTTTVTRSTFSGNRAFCEGGAIANGDDGTGALTITASTFSGNGAPEGAAIENGDGGSGRLSVTASTFSGNTASSGGATIDNGDGGGRGSTLAAGADILAGSCRQVSGTWTDLGENVASSPSCLKAGKGDVATAKLAGLLGPLADNGGPTETMALLPGNPANGLIPEPTSGLCPVAADQTGRPGPAGAPCNAGSLQLHPVISSVTFSGTAVTPTVTVTGAGFGSQANIGAPTPASICSGRSSTGDDYAGNLYLYEWIGKWGAGEGPPAACDYYGLLISQYSATRIIFTLGSDYPTYGKLKLGDLFTMRVLGAALSGGIAPAPVITGFSPASGRVGTTVTIRGSGLAHASEVTVNGVKAPITDDTAGTIKVRVPKGATSGRIQVTAARVTVASATAFDVT
ncbi:MAG: IPT/TIG domain-containing protein [Acidimicrobiales bacterium]|jgi:hypothetical protein